MGHPCCSVKCREYVPTCVTGGCGNACELGNYKGCWMFTSKCYQCGGRAMADKEILEYEYLENYKAKYMLKGNVWLREGCTAAESKDISNLVFDTAARVYVNKY